MIGNERRLPVIVAANDDEVLVAVAHTGRGIKDESRDRITRHAVLLANHAEQQRSARDL